MPPRGAVDQHPFAGFEPTALKERVIGGLIDVAKYRRFLEAQRRGNKIAALRLAIAQLGKSAEPLPAHDPITRLTQGCRGRVRHVKSKPEPELCGNAGPHPLSPSREVAAQIEHWRR